MSGKHYRWHKYWHRTVDGHLQHASGLLVLVTHDPGGGIDLDTDDASLAAWQAFEHARGVPAHDLPARILRLMKEAELWQKHGR